MRYLFLKGKVVDANGCFGIAQDITAQKESENALVNSEQKFRLLAENSEDIISVHAADGTIWYLSPSVTHVLGYEVEEVIGTAILDYVHPDDRHKFFKQDKAEALQDKESIIIRYRICKKDQTYLWLETIIKPIVDQNEVIKLDLYFQKYYRPADSAGKTEKERPAAVCRIAGHPLITEQYRSEPGHQLPVSKSWERKQWWTGYMFSKIGSTRKTRQWYTGHHQ